MLPPFSETDDDPIAAASPADHIRPAGWLYSLLSAPNDWLFKTWVNLESEEVEVQAGQMIGHFIE